jgi:hypothetical protein
MEGSRVALSDVYVFGLCLLSSTCINNLLCIEAKSALKNPNFRYGYSEDKIYHTFLLSIKMSELPVGIHQKGKPWPGYFLVRTTGEVVPLVAVDELPPNIELVGVPRSLDLEETIGMLNLGLQRSNGGFYQIRPEHDSKTETYEAVGKAE